jgi:polysaccharide export outer membrane protein
VALALALSVGLAGCGGGRYPLVSAAEANNDLGEGYHLGPGDKLRINVFDEPTLTGEYQVAVDGTVSLPLIEALPAAGMSPDQLARSIETKLAAGGYVLSPKVAAEVLDYRPFYILGEVNKPGEYAYTGQISLLQAIAKAGGFTPRANKGKVVIRRKDWPTARTARVGDGATLIGPGDTILVREALF